MKQFFFPITVEDLWITLFFEYSFKIYIPRKKQILVDHKIVFVIDDSLTVTSDNQKSYAKIDWTFALLELCFAAVLRQWNEDE